MSNEQNQQVSVQKKQSLTRRLFLKWGIIGGLVALPLGLIAYQKLKGKKNYEYIINGPLRLESEGVVLSLSDWKNPREDWYYWPDQRACLNDLKSYGDRYNIGYWPRKSILCPGGFDNDWSENVVILTTTFSIKNDVLDTFVEKVTITAESENKILYSKDAYVNAPHKKIVPFGYQVESEPPGRYPMPRETIDFCFPEKYLAHITSIRYHFESL
ncbi:MAG: hypothetical protein LBE12_10805 [Planctomycetaceae bacterium]|jgi:hypothetical protein|nr:hypothetical protein [Planctomycetaceae bacterium]